MDNVSFYQMLKAMDEISDQEFIYAHYPEHIKIALSEALSNHCLKYGITEKNEISMLSNLIDDAAFNIEIAMKKRHIELKKSE